MGMFVHRDHDEETYYEQRAAVETLGINYARETGSTKAITNVTNQTPPTIKDVLLERWRGDTRKMAQVTLEAIYDSEDDLYVFEDGFMTSNHDEALDHEVTRLNGPAEVEA